MTSRPRVRIPRNVGRKVQPEDVIAYSLAHPQRSTKIISGNCDLSKSHVWKILDDLGTHPYQSTPVQGNFTTIPRQVSLSKAQIFVKGSRDS